MELSLSRASLTMAVVMALMVILCTTQAQTNYIAFPRMGRSGYLAFPRMGRSQLKSETAHIGTCCGVGLKSEFLIGQDGKEELRAICPAQSECCDGLRELIDQKPDGVFYSMCLPDVPLPRDTSAGSGEVLNKLKSLLEK